MPYVVLPAENRLKALTGAKTLKTCEDCGLPLNKSEVDFDMRRPPATGLGLSWTQDGLLLASAGFHSRYHSEGWTGLEFRKLSSGAFAVSVARQVPLLQTTRTLVMAEPPLQLVDRDAGARIMVTRTNGCARCGQYETLQGGGAPIIARGELPVAPKEFVLSDVLLGRGRAQRFHLIAGDAIHGKHLDARIAGVSMVSYVRYEPWARPGVVRGRGTARLYHFPQMMAPRGMGAPANDRPN